MKPSIITRWVQIASLLSFALSLLGCKYFASNTAVNTSESELQQWYQAAESSSDIEKIVYIRRLVADTIDSGTIRDSMLESFSNTPFNHFEINQYMERFARDAGHVNCALAANIMCKTLNNMGIESYSYNFGFENTPFTHVVVLAKLSQNYWTLHDPTFNYSLNDSSGVPKDFFQLLEDINLHQFDNIVPSSDTVWRDLLLTKEVLDRSRDMGDSCKQYFLNTLKTSLDSTKYLTPICYSCEPDSSICENINFKQMMASELKKVDSTDSFWGTLRFQIGSTWGPKPEQLQSKIDSVLKRLQPTDLDKLK